MNERVVNQPCRVAAGHSRIEPQGARAGYRPIRDRPSGAGRGAGRRAGAWPATRVVCRWAGGRRGDGYGVIAGATGGGGRRISALVAWRRVGANGWHALWSRPCSDRHCARPVVAGRDDRYRLAASSGARRPALSGDGGGDGGGAWSSAAHRPDRNAAAGAGGRGIGHHRPNGADRRRSRPQCGGNPLAGGRRPLRRPARRCAGAQRLRPYPFATAGRTGWPALARGMASPTPCLWRIWGL